MDAYGAIRALGGGYGAPAPYAAPPRGGYA